MCATLRRLNYAMSSKSAKYCDFNQRCFYIQKPVAAEVLSERITLISKKVYEVS